jgi:uncharacterized protein (DUF2141 family)
VLEKVDPPDSSINFNDRTITFTFDEYLDQLRDITENLIISPTPIIEPRIEAKLKTIVVRLRDSLEPNTTYYFNFGNAIRDINEGNVLRDFSYIFTTGPVIDTLELTGKVILAETGKTDSTLIVMLHKSADDSAVIKEIPRYITRLDGRGNFRFRFLPPGTYHIYALKDEGRTRKYFAKSQLFAFADKPVEIKPATEPVTLYAFAERKVEPFSPGLSINRPGGNRPDDRRLKFSHNLNNNQQDLLGNFVFTFEQPLRFFDSSKVIVSIDSTFTPVTPISWQLDTTKKKLSLQINWIENRVYNIILDKDFAEDTLKRKLLKTDTIRFKTKTQNEYGQLKLRFRNLDLSKNPVLLFIQGEQVMKSFPLKSESFIQTYFLPGEYDLRILYDENGNGIWDTGNFFGNRRQPELVKPIDRKITVRMNWNNEAEITL